MERLIKIGTITPKASKDVKESKVALGFEKLDRNVFDPEKAYGPVAETGVKYVRLQSGWQRTEREPGVYHFEWLDDIVDNLIARGLTPWMTLCYGNDLYSEKAKEIFGAVGIPPIATEEEREAWDRYVRATAEHFRGRITLYEVWNEPDGSWCWKIGPNGTDYGAFVVRTSRAVKAVDPDAKIIGGSICMGHVPFTQLAIKEMANDIDYLTFHEYTSDEVRVFERVKMLRALCDIYNPKIKIIQGESGCPSDSHGNGAMRLGLWTREKQAKYLLRHLTCDLLCDVEFASYFSTMDMIEALNGKVGETSSYLDYGYFGILGAEFDENGYAIGKYEKKPSYYALQNFASLFSGKIKVGSLPVMTHDYDSPRTFAKEPMGHKLVTGTLERENGAKAFLYYKKADILTETYDGTVTFEITTMGKEVKLVDPMTGTIYALPKAKDWNDGQGILWDDGKDTVTLQHLPLKDYPLILLIGDFIED